MRMPKTVYIVITVLAMVAIIVGLDVTLLRDDTWLRLIVNICIVLAFGVFYFLVLKKT